jgi:hypothetical protein
MIGKLKTKTAVAVVKAFEEQILPQAQGNLCRVLVSDNGSEYKNELFSEFCRENNIKQVFGLTYNPQSNALSEATNGFIRRVIRALFIKNGDANWSNHIPEILKSINDTVASSIGKSRSEVFLEGKHIDTIHDANLKQKRELKQDDEIHSFHIGDKVRVSLNSIDTDVRKRNKNNLSKYVTAKFSFEIYTIEKIIKSKSAFSKNRYKITDHNGNILSKEFFGNELQLVPENTIRNENLTANKISKINKTPIVDQYVQNIIPVANRTRNNNYYEGNYFQDE